MSNLMKTAVVLCAVMMGLTAQARDRQCFDNNWRFHLGDSVQMSKVEYNDSWWRKLDVPHDWAIEGDFYAGNPSGAGGGALPGGIGWYRKHFRIEESNHKVQSSKFFAEQSGKAERKVQSSILFGVRWCIYELHGLCQRTEGGISPLWLQFVRV